MQWQRNSSTSSSLSFLLFLLTIFVVFIDHQFIRMKIDRFIEEEEKKQLKKISRSSCSVSSTLFTQFSHPSDVGYHKNRIYTKLYTNENKSVCRGPNDCVQHTAHIHTHSHNLSTDKCVCARMYRYTYTCCSPISNFDPNTNMYFIRINLYACTHIEQHTLCNRNLHFNWNSLTWRLVSSYERQDIAIR